MICKPSSFGQIRSMGAACSVVVAGLCFASACSSSSSSGDGDVGQGGNSSQGGSAQSHGGAASGGVSSGGASNPGQGGSAPRGGSPGSGGASASGGAAGASRGGAAASGGSASGGVANAGAPAAGAPNGGAAAGGATAGGASNGGSSGKPTICKFSSGLNVAWVRFANDVPDPDLTTFKTIFKNTHDAGGRVARWWFHTNGSVTPGYDASGMPKALQQSHVDGIKAILGAAHDAGVSVVISLWSFDMLQENAGAAHTNNSALLEKDANRQAYVDNYLTPLVKAIKGTPGLYSWEIFNEPEGMSPTGWATYRTTMDAIQKTVNWLAAAIHTADPDALVTNGAQTFDYCSSVTGKKNYYTDEALRAAGGKQNGILDYYEVHYYKANGGSNSAFTYPVDHWGLDKKLVIGEFGIEDTDGTATNDLYKKLYDNGYNGAWSWAYTADWQWPKMQAPMKALFDAHADAGTCP